MFDNAREYTVSGLITEMILRDGKNSGEKICFLTLEDYTGSYSFRLGDRDYMKLREKNCQRPICHRKNEIYTRK